MHVTLRDSDQSSATDGVQLPPGGNIGDYLIKTSSGLGWKTPTTLYDMGQQS